MIGTITLLTLLCILLVITFNYIKAIEEEYENNIDNDEYDNDNID